MRDTSNNIKSPGRVFLVGAGCEAGQITQRGLKAIQEADVIVYDDLLDMSLLALARADCELIEAGKRCGSHKKEQDETQKLLIDEAQKGKRVVRLKGGDPTVFGRGGEEFLAMREAGIPCELIPGVSSCIAAPEHMGISITQRGMASSFTVVTAHGAKETAEDYGTLAALKGTLVFLMGLTKAREISEGLIGAGKDPETPAAILSCVFRQEEKRLDGTLGDLPALAEGAQMPAIIVIGKTASLHLCDEEPETARTEAVQPETARSETVRPTAAQQVTVRPAAAQPAQGCAFVVGTASFTKKMAGLLREDGMRAVEYPCVGLVPQPEEIPDPSELKQYDWVVFTSANGVRIFAEEMFGTADGRKADARAFARFKFACIGPGTAQALKEDLHKRADLIPDEYTTESLALALGMTVKPGEKVLLLRAADANPLLTKALECEKISYRDCRIYRTRYFDPETGTDPESADYILFGSAGAVRAFLKARPLPDKAVPVCIGRITQSELESRTGRRAVTAVKCTAEGVRQALREHNKGLAEA